MLDAVTAAMEGIGPEVSLSETCPAMSLHVCQSCTCCTCVNRAGTGAIVQSPSQLLGCHVRWCLLVSPSPCRGVQVKSEVKSERKPSRGKMRGVEPKEYIDPYICPEVSNCPKMWTMKLGSTLCLFEFGAPLTCSHLQVSIPFPLYVFLLCRPGSSRGKLARRSPRMLVGLGHV